MKKVLKPFVLLFLLPYRQIRKHIHQIRNFFFPNLINLIKKLILFKTIPRFNQKTLCEGQGKVIIGENCSFGYKLGGFYRNGSIELQARYPSSTITIGNNVSSNNNVFLCAANSIIIGDDTLIGQNVCIMDHEAHGVHPDKRKSIGKIGSVIIGNNVWIGNNVTILKNSEIGNNSIVAAGAVVTGKFPKDVIIGGIPAKVIRHINDEHK